MIDIGPNRSAGSLLEDLPLEHLDEIFRRVAAADVAALLLTCKSFWAALSSRSDASIDLQAEWLCRCHGTAEKALTLACKHMLRPSVMRRLILKGELRPGGAFNVNMAFSSDDAGERSRRPIDWVCEHGSEAALSVLLEECPDIDVNWEGGWMPLLTAARRGQAGLVRQLLRHPNVKTLRPVIAKLLSAACRHNFLHTVPEVLGLPDAKDLINEAQDGIAPLAEAVFSRAVESARVLLQQPGIDLCVMADDFPGILEWLPEAYDLLPAILPSEEARRRCLLLAVRGGGGGDLRLLLTHPLLCGSEVKRVSQKLLRKAICLDVLHEMPELIQLPGVDVNKGATDVVGEHSEDASWADDFEERSCLALAAMAPSLRPLRLLLQHPAADVASANSYSQTVFHAATLVAPWLLPGVYEDVHVPELQQENRERLGHAAETMKLLLTHLLERPTAMPALGQLDCNGNNVLHAVCLLPGLLGRVPELLQQPYISFIEVNARNAEHFDTPLLLSCKCGDAGAVAALLGTEGVDANVADVYGNTPLIAAVRAKDPASVQQLLQVEGIDIDARGKLGKTALEQSLKCAAVYKLLHRHIVDGG